MSTEEESNTTSPLTSARVDAVIISAATNDDNEEEECDGIGAPKGYEALPLTNFEAYCDLVRTLYKTSLAMILGNSLEWLDFSIYGYSSNEITSQLFGGSRAAYWGSFGLGFAARPFGAFVLGKLSDEKSRKLSFIVSMLAMSTSTALMSLIPAVCNNTDNDAVATIGSSYCVSNLWMSAIPAIILRCFQGFSAGAAAGGVNVIQSELWSTTDRKGAIAQSVGVQNVSGGGASMLSAAVVYGLRAAMGEVRYAVWGWRIAFLIVVPPSLYASHLMHKSTPESNHFAKLDGRIEEDNDRFTEDTGGNEDGDAVHTNLIGKSWDARSGSAVVLNEDEDRFADEEDPICTGSDDRRGSSSTKGKQRGAGHAPSSGPSSLPPSVRLRNDGSSSAIFRSVGDRDTNEPENTNTTPWWLLISVLVFSQFAISGFNNLTVFLVEFAQTNYGVTANTSTLMQVAGKAVQVLMTPFAAAMGDVKGWYWTCAFGGTLCTILALPMMAAGNFGGVAGAWILVSGCLPVTSTFWILNAPLLATSVFPVGCRSRGSSLVLATAAGMAGFLPLVLEEIPNTYAQGCVLMVIAALGTIGILWVRNRAKNGNVIIYQRPELF